MQIRSGMIFLLLMLTCALTAPLVAQNAEQMPYAAMTSSKFMTLPVLPACMSLSAQRGDPMKGPAVLLVKFTSGCVVPWHWHTLNENLMMVSGKAKAEMKPGGYGEGGYGKGGYGASNVQGAHMMSAGDYIFLAGKEVHQFTCISSCVVFDVIDGAFDIHYVNADGKELTPEEALKPMAKPAAAKKP